MRKKRIVIAEDHTILREGLRALLSSAPDLEVIGEAENGRAAIQCAENMEPNLILMDLSMPRMTGMDAIREIKKRVPDTRILALTVKADKSFAIDICRIFYFIIFVDKILSFLYCAS